MDLCQAFLNRERILGVEYQHNDYVRVPTVRTKASLALYPLC
jgi:hypothetical protein